MHHFKQIIHNLVDVSLSDSFITIHDSVTRGHSYKSIRQHCRVNARANFFYQSCYCSLEFTAWWGCLLYWRCCFQKTFSRVRLK